MLDWQRFGQLAGDDTANFEKLCRGIIRRHFGYLGALKELKNQPGVEYHLNLSETNSKLGKAGQSVGWQCKWFQYKASGEFTASAKEQVEHSLKKTKEHLPSIDVWILWTHKTLAKSDQIWFYSLESKYGFKLHLWNEEDLDSLLSGNALDLRHSYFGELALTPEMLSKQHAISVAPIRKRWLHDVHQRTSIEDTTRKILGEPSAWKGFGNIAKELTWAIKKIEKALKEDIYKIWEQDLNSFVHLCQNLVCSFELFKTTISGEHISYVETLLTDINDISSTNISQVLRVIRRRNLPLSLVVTNAIAAIKDAKKNLKKAVELFAHQLVAVVADAGGGKTQFSAELSSDANGRPAGILLLGRDLKSNFTLDDIAKRISFYSGPIENFEQLIIALDAAGARSGCRLPIIIDGLNEAEDPREWKPLLASAEVLLKNYPNVVLICTLRTGELKRNYPVRLAKKNNSREDFAHKGLPDDCFIIESTGFSEKVTMRAINAYFHHYKIKADPLIAPRSFFRHPLNLKIFCEVTNREASEFVTVTHFPASIYSLFEAQVGHVAQTISSMTNLSINYNADDIEDAIYYLGETIWDEGCRAVPEKEFRQRFQIEAQDWYSDIVNLLSQEGLLFRDQVGRRYFNLTPAYDRMGGYFVAYYLLQKNENSENMEWLNEDYCKQKLFSDGAEQHELSQDIVYALVALFSKYNSDNLWQCVPPNFQNNILELSHLIDANNIDDATKEAYSKNILDKGLDRNTIEKLEDLKMVVDHPFNIYFFDEVLTQLSMSDRDLSWSEHIRFHNDDIVEALNYRIDKWRSKKSENSKIDKYRALSISWLLTSTSIELRDKASEALFYFGLRYPATLFEITSNKLSVNDPYVIERMLGVSYGVVGTLIPNERENEAIADFSNMLYKRVFSDEADVQLVHLFSREYASQTIQITHKHLCSAITTTQALRSSYPFSSMVSLAWGKMDVKDLASGESPFRMDFENYTIGRLIQDRGNYDFDHPDYQDARAKILWRVHDLGWSGSKFKDIESKVGSSRYYSRGERAKVERYGKKYSWIAYYELAGELDCLGKLEKWHKRFDADIDPFFPEPIKESTKASPRFLGNNTESTSEWISTSEIPCIEKLTTKDKDPEQAISWVLLKGTTTEESKRLDRNFYCSMRMFFTTKQNEKKLKDYLSEDKQMSWPEQQQTTYVYSGEIYENALNELDEEQFIEITVGSESKEIETPEIKFEGGSFIIGQSTKRIVEQPVYDEVLIKYPLIGYYWERRGGELVNTNSNLLSPWLLETLSLEFNPVTRIYLDKEGQEAVKQIKEIGEESSNNEELFYLREDLFEELLKQTELVAGYNIYGERRIAHVEALHSDKKHVTYEQFESSIFVE